MLGVAYWDGPSVKHSTDTPKAILFDAILTGAWLALSTVSTTRRDATVEA